MRMWRVLYTRRLPCRPDAKAVFEGQIHFLRFAFGHTTADNTVIIFEVTAGRFGINKCRFAGH